MKDLLFTLSDDTKKQGQKTDILREYVDKNAKDVNIELFMSKESMENELHDLLAKNSEIEAELGEIKGVAKEMKDRSSKPSDKTSTRMRQQRGSEKTRTDKTGTDKTEKSETPSRTVPPSERSKKTEKKSETTVPKSKKSSFSPSKPRRSQPPVESKSTPTKQLNIGSNSDANSRLQPRLDEMSRSTFDKLNTVSESQAEGENLSPESNKKIVVSNLNQKSNKSSSPISKSKSTSRPRGSEKD